MGLFSGLIDKFKQGLQRTQELVLAPMGRLLGLKRLDEDQLLELEELLLQADLGVHATDRLMERLRFELKRSSEIDPKAVLKDELLKILQHVPTKPFLADGVQVLLLVGVNGVGKTTTVGKLAAQFKARGEEVLVVAGDTFRAAAIDQLELWGERAGVPACARTLRCGGSAGMLAGVRPWAMTLPTTKKTPRRPPTLFITLSGFTQTRVRVRGQSTVRVWHRGREYR